MIMARGKRRGILSFKLYRNVKTNNLSRTYYNPMATAQINPSHVLAFNLYIAIASTILISLTKDNLKFTSFPADPCCNTLAMEPRFLL